ncbi:MAG TPA: hypothetical protein VM032_18230 [Vicinamibacterales bacterium]|nr:hypothetical protein [Vicinamibacterales bacterium]
MNPWLIVRWTDALTAREHSAVSPLWLVADEPLVNDLVVYLDQMRRQIEAAPGTEHTITFSRSTLREVRAAFARMIRRGEERLHRFCELAGTTFLDGRYALQSLAVGSVITTKERFTVVQDITPADLYSLTDLDLGNRQVARLRYFDGERWSPATLVANVVEYHPESINGWRVYKMVSRIKAEEQIWNKVVDTIFDLDRLVELDKQLRHLNRFVKDVFGVKFVVSDPDAVRALQDRLRSLCWSPEQLEQHGVPVRPTTTSLDCLEVKDYLNEGDGLKASGWQAIKSVFHWWDTMIEVQVQPLANYLQERERLTRESHTGFKSRREDIRNQVAAAIPLFGFYRDLLKWLFLEPDAQAPLFDRVTIVVAD